jgi:hypothetical protein
MVLHSTLEIVSITKLDKLTKISSHSLGVASMARAADQSNLPYCASAVTTIHNHDGQFSTSTCFHA